MAKKGSIEAIGASRGMISTRVVGTTTRVTRGRMSSGNGGSSSNGGTHGSPYASQRHIQMS